MIFRRTLQRQLSVCTEGEMFLSELPIGRSGRVISLLSEGITRNRLLDLGLVTGTLVEAVRRSPAGDPTAFNIRGALIALRKEESDKIIISIY